MRRHIEVLMSLALVLVVSSCGGGQVLEPTRGEIGFEPSAPVESVEAIAASDMAFTFDLLRALAGDENVFVSPMSISTGVGMVAAGARGETREQIAEVLHETLSDDLVHAARGTAFAEVSTPDQVGEDQGDAFVLRGANSAWISPGWPFSQEYLDGLARDYDAGVFATDFADKTAAAERISGWAEGETEGRIVDLVGEADIPDLTVLILVNAVVFDGSWMNQFDPHDTTQGDFTLGDGTVVTVPMMHGRDFDVDYVEGSGFEAVWLPYWGGASMMIALPDGSPSDWLLAADARSVRELRATSQSQPFTDLSVPRFELEARLELSDTLRDLGMPLAFDFDADLTGMIDPTSGARYLALAAVIHQAVVTVDEVGTKAAAATAVVETTVSAKPEPRELAIDRPFVFFIVDDDTGAPIFAGIVENPAES